MIVACSNMCRTRLRDQCSWERLIPHVEKPKVRIDRNCGKRHHKLNSIAQLREKKACGSRRDTAHDKTIVGACPKQWASSLPEATRPMMRLPHEKMQGQNAQMLPPKQCHSLWHKSFSNDMSTALALLQDGSLWGHEHHVNPTN